MPLFDLPMEEMRKYHGKNPCPHDFDEYWDRGLAEMRALDPAVELRPSGFQCSQADCFDLYFTGVGGARVHAKYLRPRAADGRHPALLLFHGYSGSSGDWNDKLNWVALGFSVLAMDCRGQAGTSQDAGGISGPTQFGLLARGLDDAPDKLYFRQVFLDAAQLAGIAFALPEVDPARVACAGASQGGALTLACAALQPGIRKAASLYPFLCDFQRVYEMELADTPYQEIREFFRQRDPLHQRERELFTRLGYIDVRLLAGRIRAEALMVTAMMDQVCPPSTQFAAYNKIRSRKDMLLYPDHAHEALPGAWDRVFEFLSGL